MDRLIIEATLEDVNEIFLSKNVEAVSPEPTLILGFKALNMDQIIRAFAELRKIAEQHPIDLVICKTMVSGIYDLEIKTDGLDEPVRIMNKSISSEILGEIEDQIGRNEYIALGTNVSGQQNWIPIQLTHIKDCESNHHV